MAERDFNLQMTGEQVKDALQQLEDRVAEGWSVGEKDGVPVTSGSPYFENNARYYSQQAGLSAAAAASSAATAEQEVEEGIRQGIVGTYVQESATPGAIVTIDDGADDVPLKDLKVNLDIVQPGTGDPSPTNVRPIYPVTEAEVSVSNGNLWDEQWELGTIAIATGANTSSSTIIRSKNICPCAPNAEFYLGEYVGTIFWYDAVGGYIGYNYNNATGNKRTSPSNAHGFRIITKSSYGTTYLHNISINYPATDTSYHAYAGQQYLVNISINQWDEEWELGAINPSTGEPYAQNTTIRSKNFIPVLPNTVYTIVQPSGTGGAAIAYDKDKAFISTYTSGTATPSNCYYLKFYKGTAYGTVYNHDISINFPARFTEYRAYTGNVVYGGELDVTTGVLTARCAKQTLDGTESWSAYAGVNGYRMTISDMKNGLDVGGKADWLPTVTGTSSLGIQFGRNDNRIYIAQGATLAADLTAWQTYLASNPLEIVYPLATPISIQLTPTEVDTLRGDNVIFCDAGDITNCEYRADLKMYIDKVVGA